MADDETLNCVPSHGADWEVVALSTSAYASTSEPDTGPSDDGRDNEYRIDHDPSRAMFMSQHFVFPPHEHENLPIQLDFSEIQGQTGKHGTLDTEDEPNRLDGHDEENWKSDLFINFVELEDDQAHSSYHVETDGRDMILSVGENNDDKSFDSYDQNSDLYQDVKSCMENSDGKKIGRSSLPCQAWWKRHAISLHKHAKETRSFWSIFMAAALMGLVVLGQQWHREKVHLRQLKWQFSITNEKMNRILVSLNRFKDTIVGDHRRSPLIHSGAVSTLIN